MYSKFSIKLILIYSLSFFHISRFILQFSVFKVIQGPLVAVTAGILLNLGFKSIPNLALKADQVVRIPVAESISGFFSQFTFPDFTQWNNPDVYVVGITLAIVASLETLLCVEATDKLDPQKTKRRLVKRLKELGYCVELSPKVAV